MPSTRYPRPSERDDFGRVMSFTDAVFAIAMTLLVVEIGVPETIGGAVDDPAALLGAFADKGPLIFAFFLGCYVIGFYWAAHHRFMSWLEAVDRGFVLLTVVYLAFVALLPFPTGVLGEFGENPISVIAFAVNMAAVSGMETVLFSHARRRRLFREEPPEDVYRWALGRRCCPCWRSRSRSRSPSPYPGWRSSSGSWRSRSSWSGPGTGRRAPAGTSTEG